MYKVIEVPGLFLAHGAAEQLLSLPETFQFHYKALACVACGPLQLHQQAPCHVPHLRLLPLCPPALHVDVHFRRLSR